MRPLVIDLGDNIFRLIELINSFNLTKFYIFEFTVVNSDRYKLVVKQLLNDNTLGYIAYKLCLDWNKFNYITTKYKNLYSLVQQYNTDDC